MGLTWNDCELIFDGSEFLVDIYKDSSKFAAFNKYVTQSIRGYPKNRVWYDTVADVCFGHEQTWYNSNGYESYLALEDQFYASPHWGEEYVEAYYHSSLPGELYRDEEIMCSAKLKEMIENKKVLVIGGGPTTLSSNWNPEDYDLVVPCNHFFLKDEYKGLNVPLAFIGGDEVDSSSDNYQLYDYAKNSDTVFCFENRSRPAEELRNFQRNFPDQSLFMHTRYRSKIGTVPRIVVAMSLLGASEVHVAGMDGFKKTEKLGDEAEHAFEPGKRRAGAHNYDMYRRHYVVLWDYILNVLGSKAVFQNLGEGHESNMSTDISKQMFPLSNGE